MSSENLLNHVSMDVGQPEVTPGLVVSEALMIKPQQMQNRCMHIVYMHPVLHRFETEFVCLSPGHPTPHATASQPH